MTKIETSDRAKRIARAVLRNLEGRKGFDWWWADVDADTRKEIRADLAEAIEKAAGFSSLRVVLADRERELLEIKGPCSVETCRLHYAHSGPCDIRPAATAVRGA